MTKNETKERQSRIIKMDLHPFLRDVEFEVCNVEEFMRCYEEGEYEAWSIKPLKKDEKRVKQFAVKYGFFKDSRFGYWIAKCNGYAMNLTVFKTLRRDNDFRYIINTYNDYRQFGEYFIHEEKRSGHSGCRSQYEEYIHDGWARPVNDSIHFVNKEGVIERRPEFVFRYPAK